MAANAAPRKETVMEPSSAICRAQEALHRSRAATAALPNIRLSSERVAVAWGREALCADRREERQEASRLLKSRHLTDRQQLRDDQALSENPDRGFAD